LLTNEDIKAKEVRMIGADQEQLGIISLDRAKSYAYEKGLDLVLIAPQGNPPVCRAMDYGKFRFERDKKDKEARKKQQISKVKEVKLSCRIDVHDFNTRLKAAIRFLSDGDKVKVIVAFRGREMTHLDIGRAILERFEEACREHGLSEKKPIMEGRFMSVLLMPVKKSEKAEKLEKSEKSEKPEKTEKTENTDNK
jgi:translation initiation factor IF-3